MSDREAPDTKPPVRVWLFGTNMPRAELDALLDPAADRTALLSDQFRIPDVVDEREPIAVLLGTNWVDPDYIKIIDPNELGDISLADYLVQGIGIDQAQILAISGVLSKWKSPLVVAVFEQALGGQPACMHPGYRLIPIGFYTDQPGPSDYSTTWLPSKKPRKSTAGYGALLAPMLVVAIIAWVYWGR